MLAFPAISVAVGATTITGRIAASDHTCALTTRAGVTCWGDNSAGGLGDGTTNASSTPVNVAGLTSGVIAIAAGDRSSCALTTGGGVKCWGYNQFGQLGDGTTTNRTTPVDVTGLTSGVSAIAARGEHACALIAAAVKCWGANINGQLGDGTTISSDVPVDVVALAGGVIAIAVGGEHSCAVTTGGGLKCWGWNATGQLGVGTKTDNSTPVDVTGLASGVSAIAAGGRHTCALMSAGEVKCWGYDQFGQLGDGTTTNSATPVDVAGLTGSISAITAGGNFTCALTTDSKVECWGINSAGQLGDDPAMVVATPVDVAGVGSRLTAIIAGYYHIRGIARHGGVICWGGNDTGQLGNGTTGDSPGPFDVRYADGTLLIASSADDLPTRSLLPPAITVAAGVVLILAAGWQVIARRRRAGRPRRA
jgi:alpha-tubulin suppressor-like RCC1 family protein